MIKVTTSKTMEWPKTTIFCLNRKNTFFYSWLCAWRDQAIVLAKTNCQYPHKYVRIVMNGVMCDNIHIPQLK